MNIESTNDKLPTAPAITYSECYRLPFLSLFHADCMDIMKQYPDKYFDLAIVDPPYGAEGMWQSGGNTWGKRKEMKDWEIRPTKEYFKELFRVSKNQIIWGGNYFIDNLYPTRCFIIWDKVTRNMWADGEMAWTSFNENIKILTYAKSDANINDKINLPRIHPTQKPVKLYEFCIKHFATEGMKILDTHFGGGSIALAVDKANRLDKMNLHLTACEIDKEYIDKAIKRISESIKQGTLSF